VEAVALRARMPRLMRARGRQLPRGSCHTDKALQSDTLLLCASRRECAE